MWTSSPAQAALIGWLAAPYLAEIPLRSGPDRFSLMVLGRDIIFGHEDARQLNAVRRHLAAVEAVMARLEPADPGAGEPGEPALTVREQQVLTMLNEGLLARTMAQRLRVSERTVHKHLGSLYRKLNAHDRLLAVRRGQQLGLLDPSGARDRQPRGNAG